MKSFFNLLLISFIYLLIQGCTDYFYQDKIEKGVNMEFNQKVGKIVSSASIYNLTNEEVVMYKQQALNGDIESALRLKNYYTFTDHNNEEIVKWLEQAIINGDINSIPNIAITYKIMHKFQEALYWAEKYKEYNLEEANELIEHIKEQRDNME